MCFFFFFFNLVVLIFFTIIFGEPNPLHFQQEKDKILAVLLEMHNHVMNFT